MPGTQHAFEFLSAEPSMPPAAVAVFGTETFLRRLVRNKLRVAVAGDEMDAASSTFDGESAEWRDVADELATVSLFGGHHKRLVIIEDADDFVTAHRSQLEKWVARPGRTSVLVLVVESWAANTRLYQALNEQGLQVDCRLPQKSGSRGQLDEPRLIKWLSARAQEAYQVRMDTAAARLLWELAGPDLGIVDQELAKLALFAGERRRIMEELVQEVIGGWRAKTIWDICDAAAGGDAAEALRHWDRAMQSGEVAQAFFGQISWSLRRFAVATRLYQRAERRGERLALRQALVQAGFREWPADVLPKAEKQLMQLGRDRAGHILKWLLETDLALKGSHASPARARQAIELLFLRLARRTPAVSR